MKLGFDYIDECVEMNDMNQQSTIPSLLVADDNLDFCMMLQSFIQQDGCVELVGMAHNGVDAVNQVVHLQPDILLLDMIMPVLDGLGVLEHLQEMKLEKRPRIAMVSAVHDDHFTQKALNLGADYYFIKPFKFSLMLRRMKDLVSDEFRAQDGAQPKRSEKLPQSAQMQQMVTGILQELGIPAHIQGFYFLREGILLAVEDISYLSAITKVLYPAIALKYDSTPVRVERSIRHAIEVAWDRGRVDVINRLFGYTVQMDKGKPTNSEFMAMIADRVRMQLSAG